LLGDVPRHSGGKVAQFWRWQKAVWERSADSDGLPSGFKLELRDMNLTLDPLAATLESQVQPVTEARLLGRARPLQRGRSWSPQAALRISRHSWSLIHTACSRWLPLHEKNHHQELCLCLDK